MAGNMDQAASRMRETADLQEKLKDETGLGSTLDSLGSLLKEKNDLEGAEECFARAMEIKEKQNDTEGLAELYGNRVNVLLMLGKIDVAEKLIKASMRTNKKSGNEIGLMKDYR